MSIPSGRLGFSSAILQKISKSFINFYFDQGISSDENKLKHILPKSSQSQAEMFQIKDLIKVNNLL